MKIKIFWLGVTLFFLFLSYYVVIGLLKNDGHLVYPVDDAYIHLAIANNLVDHGVWGVTQYQFTSSTSSPLYTFLLAIATFIFGRSELYPLLFNLIAGILILYSLYHYAHINWSNSTYAIISLSVIIFTPLHIIVLSGMEHTLHILILLNLLILILNLKGRNEVTTKEWIILLLLTSSLIMLRYESIFILTLIGLVFMFERRYFLGLAIFFFTALPIILYGLYSINNGSFFFPNSLLVKGSVPHLSIASLAEFVLRAYKSIFYDTPHLSFLAILLIMSIYFLKETNFWLQIIVIISIVAHLMFAKTGWFFRYESYLVAMGLFAAYPIADRMVQLHNTMGDLKKNISLVMLVLVCIIPLGYRLITTIYVAQNATTNIYEQQYQMARFLKKYYGNESIAANDIGALVYYTNVHLFDLAGLGSNELIRSKGTDKREFLEHYANLTECKLIILYEEVFKGNIPPGWVKAGEWTIMNNRICASDTVSFYAITSEDYCVLVKNLHSFSHDLNSNVVQDLNKLDSCL